MSNVLIPINFDGEQPTGSAGQQKLLVKGLQQGVFPWGYAVHTSGNRWAYFINAKRFAETEGITL